jgi:CubicO group peptidase (beta-lactamase class C family)
MMTSLFPAALLALGPVAAASPARPPAASHAVDAVAPAPAMKRQLDAAIDRAIAGHHIVGTVVLVAHNGRVVYARAAGLADREARTPMRRDAIFLFASVSKPFVTTAAMRLAERGVISFDDPVTRYLPDFRPSLADGTRPVITLGELATHRSGLGYGFEEQGGIGPYNRLKVSDGLDQPGLSIDQNLHRLAEAPLRSAPGTQWRYSLGIDVLGAAMEAATGKTLGAIVAAEVTGPLSLRDTGFTVTDHQRLATPYSNGKSAPRRMGPDTAMPLGGGLVRFTPARIDNPRSYQSGGAGMAGTADDLMRFLEAIRRGGAPILSPASVAAMTRDQTGPQAATQGPGWGFGYGWAVLDDPAPTGTPQAAGTLQWGGVYGHSWFVDRKNRLTVVALTNTTPEGMNGPFATAIRDAVYRRGK